MLLKNGAHKFSKSIKINMFAVYASDGISEVIVAGILSLLMNA